MAALELRVVMTIGLVIFSLVMAKSSSLGEYEIKLCFANNTLGCQHNRQGILDDKETAETQFDNEL